MNCPRCKTAIPPLSSPDSIVTCPGCGSRLMTKAAARRSQGASARAASGAGPDTAPAPAPAVVAKPVSSASGGPVPIVPPPIAPAPVPSPVFAPEPRPAPPAPPPQGTNPPLPPSSATLAPTAAVLVGAVVSRREPPAPAPGGNGSEQVLRELRAVREIQERILAMLEQAIAAPLARGGSDEDGALSPIRAPRRKTVVLIDDDEASCESAARELEQADVPVRTFGDGNDALRGIAEEKPDLIVLELGLGGDMAGKDVINVIKATMEWVDIPIVLWTREPVANQKEARQIHGADEIVPKSAGAAGLVARVINVFRRG